MDNNKGLETLLVWQKAMEFAVNICRDLLPLLPPEEKYALIDQLRRSAQSIPANIAEGYGRFYYQEGIRFCYMARGSLSETQSHLLYAKQMGYLSEATIQRQMAEISELHRLLNGYIAFLKKSKQGNDEPGYAVREIPGDYEVASDNVTSELLSQLDDLGSGNQGLVIREEKK
jgi:four helix bundle protein